MNSSEVKPQSLESNFQNIFYNNAPVGVYYNKIIINYTSARLKLIEHKLSSQNNSRNLWLKFLPDRSIFGILPFQGHNVGHSTAKLYFYLSSQRLMSLYLFPCSQVYALFFIPKGFSATVDIRKDNFMLLLRPPEQRPHHRFS